MAHRLLLAAGSLFAVGEFAMLFITCLAQFEPGFSTKEAMGGIGVAFLAAILATVFAVGACLVSRDNRWAFRLAVAVWVGFAVFIMLGITLHELAVSRRSAS